MVFQPTAVHQISQGGMQVETAFPLQLDSLHDFRLTLGDRSIVVKGRVAHSRISDVDQDGVTYRSGIEFIEPSERVAAVIAISSTSSPRHGTPTLAISVARRPTGPSILLYVQVFQIVA